MRPRRLVALLLGLLAFVLVTALSGCTPTVSLTPAPDATAVPCAAIVVRLPGALSGQPKRETDAQGTAAWGDPQSVTLRCGVDPVPASFCQTINDVDWSIRGTPADRPTTYIATTYGRTPATEVVIDAKRIDPTDALSSISTSVADALQASSRCPTASQAPLPPSPSPSP